MLQIDDRWDRLRRQMPVTATWAYFDHAAVAPLTQPAAQCLADWARDCAEHGDARWPDWRKRVERARILGARLLGASADEIALVRNTTEGIGLVAEGFPWREGDNVVTLDSEFPSNLYPWLNLAARGVETRQVRCANERLDLAALEEACIERTRLISVSWVGYATGWRNDIGAIGEFAHRRGALFFLDAIQGVGAFPLNVADLPIDFLAADGHKWMLGPEGAGLFYVRREHLDLLRPLGVGWNSVITAGDYAKHEMALKPNAGRYEGGTYNTGGIAALAASLECLLDCGIDGVGARILDVTDELCERLRGLGTKIASCRDGERRSGIVAFTLPGRDPAAVKRELLDAGVVVTCRHGRVRCSPHAYTNDDDLDRLEAGLRRIVRG